MATATVHAGKDQDTTVILAMIQDMAKARYDKDVQAIAASYASDAAIFSLAPPLVHRGIDIADFQAWLDSWEGPIEITPRDFQVAVNGDLAFCHGYMRMSGKKKDSENRISFWMRETLCLKRSGGAWHIVHEHTSVPFYMDGSLRPAFDLAPED